MGKRNYLFMASESNNRLWCWNLDSFMKEKELNIAGQATWPASIALIISSYCFIPFVSRIPVLLHYCTETYLNFRCCKLLICPQILCPRKYKASLSSTIFHRTMNFIKHFFGFSSLGVRVCLLTQNCISCAYVKMSGFDIHFKVPERKVLQYVSTNFVTNLVSNYCLPEANWHKATQWSSILWNPNIQCHVHRRL